MSFGSALTRTFSIPLLSFAALFGMLAFAPAASATFHTFKVEQVYSNADGTVQFVVLRESQYEDGQQRFTGHVLTSGSPTWTTYTFPNDLPGPNTTRKHVLIATDGFAALNLVKPDYVVPNNFLLKTNGAVNFADVDEFNYATLPTDGVMALDRDGNRIQNVATNFADESASVAAVAAPPPAELNYTGIWWNAPANSESGWGINFAHQKDTIFATWFTYDTTGKAWWLVMTAQKTADATYGGVLYQTTGPAFSAPFDGSKVSATPVGFGTLTFTGADTAKFDYTVNAASQSKTITRQVFGTLPVCTFGQQADLTQATNYQDLWWNAPAGSESGWGINFAHQGDTIFATWFTYGSDGKPMWLVVTANKSAERTYTGTLYRTTGSPYNAVPYDGTKFVPTPVGTATLAFANGNAGTFSYTVDGVTQMKSVTREVFALPGTVCR